MPARRPYKVRVMAACGLAFVVSLLSLIATHFHWLPEAPDAFIQDWRTAKFSSQIEKQRDDIAVVLIDDETLSRFPFKTPINRKVLADVITFIGSAGPRAIGLDIIFDRPTVEADDSALLQALSEAKSRIIMIATDSRESGIDESDMKWQEEFLSKSGGKVSDPFFATDDNDFVLSRDVRRRFGTFSKGSQGREPFALTLAKTAGEADYPAGELIDWLLPSPSSIQPLPVYYVAARDPNAAAVDGIMLEPIRRFLKDKIVVVGGAITGSDWHRVPMTLLTNQEVPGAYVHAQMVAQLLDGRRVRDFPLILTILVVFVTTFSLYLAVEKFEESHPGIFLEFLIVGVGIGLSVLVFYLWKYNFPTSYLAIAWLGVSLLGKYMSQLVDRYLASSSTEGR